MNKKVNNVLYISYHTTNQTNISFDNQYGSSNFFKFYSTCKIIYTNKTIYIFKGYKGVRLYFYMSLKISNCKQHFENIIFNMQLTDIISFLFYSLNLLVAVAAFKAVQQGIDHELFLKN